MYKITSEIHTEVDNDSRKINSDENHVTRTFSFVYPKYFSERGNKCLHYDDDGDLILSRATREDLVIEYSVCTELRLVGLQIWRGALLLADYILSHPHVFEKNFILELGSGVGLTSIVASLLASEIVCTDVNVGGILQLIESNFARNKSIVHAKYSVMELNFFDTNWSCQLRDKLKNATIILAADVIYDDDVTAGFVSTLGKLFDEDSSRTAYVALEKRYVFTIKHFESVAPMYEEFLRCVERRNLNWSIEQIDTNFPQYFTYDRVEQMILMKIHKRRDDGTSS